MTKVDIHRYENRMKNALRQIENSDILKSNKKYLFEFHKFLLAEGISVGRVAKYMYHLYKISKWMNKPFKRATKGDILSLVQKIETNGYAENTKHDYKISIKRFYKWLSGTNKYPEIVEWIKTTVKWCNKKLPEELISEDEVKQLINMAKHPRNKAMIAFLYESGCRVGELLNMQIKSVEFDEFGASVTLDGKTGMRKIRVLSSVPYISVWLDYHPFKEKKDTPLWVDISNHDRSSPILYHNLRLYIAQLAKRIGLKKRVNPHSFRHSRATHMANHLTEAQMNNYFGWIQGSKMPSVYVHLSGRDMDDAILKMNGIKRMNTKKKQGFSPKQCHRCEKMNPPAGKFCFRCGTPLDLETTMSVEKGREKVDNAMESLLRDLLRNQNIRNIIERKAEKMNIKI